MENSEVIEKVTSFLIERFPQAKVNNIDVEESLLVNGILDSLGVLDVVAFIEEEFSVVIEDEELSPENFQSISSISRFIHVKVSGNMVSRSPD